MLIDCETCKVRGQACAGCVVNLLFGPAGATAGPDTGIAPADEAERRAVQALTDAGFEVTVLSREDSRPRLRLIPAIRRGHHAA